MSDHQLCWCIRTAPITIISDTFYLSLYETESSKEGHQGALQIYKLLTIHHRCVSTVFKAQKIVCVCNVWAEETNDQWSLYKYFFNLYIVNVMCVVFSLFKYFLLFTYLISEEVDFHKLNVNNVAEVFVWASPVWHMNNGSINGVELEGSVCLTNGRQRETKKDSENYHTHHI